MAEVYSVSSGPVKSTINRFGPHSGHCPAPAQRSQEGEIVLINSPVEPMGGGSQQCFNRGRPDESATDIWHGRPLLYRGGCVLALWENPR